MSGIFQKRIATFTLLCSCAMAGAATLTVTPSSTSNSYTGSFTLDITGLTNAEPVTISEYLDLNGSSTIDASDLLIDFFSITNGGVSTIGGITNINVPYDSNPSATAITTTPLNVSPPFETIVGQHIYRVEGPPGHFAAVTATLNVTNAPFSQSITGTVFRSGIPAPGAVAIALTWPDTSFAGGAVADNAGHYSLKLKAGSYVMLALVTNSFLDFSTMSPATITNGTVTNVSVFMTNTGVTISGKIYDLANNNGLPGVFLQFGAESFNAFAFTDTNGNYTAGATLDEWGVDVQGGRLARRGYVNPNDAIPADATGGSVANINAGLLKGNALLYGRVTNSLGAPVAGLEISASDNGTPEFEGSGFTDTNGNYAIAVVATNSLWFCGLDSDNATAAGYIAGSGAGFISISPGQASLQNIPLLSVSARLSGQVRDNLGNPISGLRVISELFVDPVLYSSQGNTDQNGNYSLGVAAGTWNVSLNCCGDEGLNSRDLYDPFTHSATIPPTNVVLNLTVYPNGLPILTQPVRFPPTSCGFNMTGTPGTNYTIQFSTNLASTNWTTLLITNVQNPGTFITDTQATNVARYYRALRGP